MLFDGTGSFGLGLGGFDISDFLGFTNQAGTMAYDNPVTNIGDYNTVSKFSTPVINNTGQPTFDTSLTVNDSGSIVPNTTGSLTNSGFGSASNIAAYGAQNTGGTDWLDTALKIAPIGAALYNDYQNRKIQKHALNENIRTNQNKRERSKSIQKQLTGNEDAELAGSDYKYI